ncbi:MAG: hypothetical protein NW215_00415 [Hyphomicrobiales bacterium]|nr:hypothetical protein [Hyphomicrobiales bacterium]
MCDLVQRLLFMSLHRIRQGNLQKLVQDAGGVTRFASLTGVAVPHISNLKNGRIEMGGVRARRFEEALGLPPLWLDLPHTGEPPPPPEPLDLAALRRASDALFTLASRGIDFSLRDYLSAIEALYQDLRVTGSVDLKSLERRLRRRKPGQS